MRYWIGVGRIDFACASSLVLQKTLVLGSTWVSCYYKRRVSRYARWLRWLKLSIWCDWSCRWVVRKPWTFMVMNGGGMLLLQRFLCSKVRFDFMHRVKKNFCMVFLLLHQGLVVSLHVAWPQVCVSRLGILGSMFRRQHAHLFIFMIGQP